MDKRRVEVENVDVDELLRQIEKSATQAVRRELQDLREMIDRLRQSSYLQKTWLTLDETVQYADVSPTTLREWREDGLPEAEIEGRVYIKREDLDAYIAEHA